MEYTVKKVCSPALHLDSAQWDKAQTGYIDKEPWPGLTKHGIPETEFWLVRCQDGFSVKFHTNEARLRSEVTRENGEVCCDSCVEFFLKPDVYDTNYINFELNPKGVMHIGLGKDRYGRQLIDEDRSIFRVESDAKDGDWSICWYIPDSFLLRYFGQICPVCRANFYKCGDETNKPHYAVWNPVESEKPDYHLSDLFGIIRIEK